MAFSFGIVNKLQQQFYACCFGRVKSIGQLIIKLFIRYLRNSSCLFYIDLNKSSKYALILKVLIGNVDQECYNIINRFNKNAYLQYIIK